MKSTWRPFLSCLLLVIAGWLATGHTCSATTVNLYPAVGVTTWPTSTFRWKDIATNLYAASYQTTYVYDDAQVTLNYDAVGSTFSGHLSAVNLKPNFAYQMKIVGKPTALWGAEGDDETNERIGYIGRWWRYQPDPGNSNDAEYEAHHDDPDYIFEGYLLFDFFVTNPIGNAEKDFAVDSSYHVLWWEHQRQPGTCDSPILWSTVLGYASHPAYDFDVGPTDVGVYAEIERQCTGTTTMPLGIYNCRFVLTEESFHQTGEGDGYWASALAYDTIQFEIVDLTSVNPPLDHSSLLVEPLQPNPFVDKTILRFALAEPEPVQFSIYDLSGRLVRRLTVGIGGTGAHQLAWDGRDLDGRRVAAGIYLYRIHTPGGFEQLGKVVLLK